MAIRFSDDLFHNTEGSDFIVRKRLPMALQIITVFAMAFAAIYFTGCVMKDSGSKTVFIVTLFCTIGILSWLTVFFSASLRDLVLATEFQNAMLAAAARLSTRFCLITKRDGSIVYIDPGFQKLFPHFMQNPDRNIESLLNSAGIAQDIIQTIFAGLQSGEPGRTLLAFPQSGQEPMQIMMSVEPLPRPRGYFLMRGRDFVIHRAAEESTPIQASAQATLESALNALPDGFLVTDASGTITYVNRTLEAWLGFEHGEIFARPYKLGHVFYQYAGKDAGRILTDAFEGDVVLQRKDKSLISMRVRQFPLGRSAGISAIVTLGGNKDRPQTLKDFG